MQLYRYLPLLVLGVLLSPPAIPQDVLTPAVTADVMAQCIAPPGYQSCVAALRAHGLGQDDNAISELLKYAPSGAANHYKIGQQKLKNFWTIVATAGAASALSAAIPPISLDCRVSLPPTLDSHFLLNPQALSDAADDSLKNDYLALSDLLAVPAGAPLYWAQTSGQVYRYCFDAPNHLFGKVKEKLGGGR